VALELVDSALQSLKEHPDYKIIVAEIAHNRLAGYICYGPTPMTRGTWDVYWVIVERRFRGLGIGKKLLISVEKLIRRKGGKRVIVDTSTQASYAPARGLYNSCGYTPVAVVPDYYRNGWHRVTYYKKLISH